MNEREAGNLICCMKSKICKICKVLNHIFIDGYTIEPTECYCREDSLPFCIHTYLSGKGSAKNKTIITS